MRSDDAHGESMRLRCEGQNELTLDCAKFPPDTVTFKVVDSELHVISSGDGFDDGVVAVLDADGQRQLRNFMIGNNWAAGWARANEKEVKDSLRFSHELKGSAG